MPLMTSVAFQVPIEFRLRLETEAAQAGVPVGTYAKSVVAEHLGVPIDEVVSRGATKLMSDEEKAAKAEADKAKAKAKREEAAKALADARAAAGLTASNRGRK